MTGAEILAAVVGLVAVVAVAWLAGRRSEAQMAALRQEVQGTVAAQAQTLTAHVGQLTQTVTQQLGQVRQELQAGVASSGQFAMQAQRDVATRLEESTNTLRQLTQQIGEVQQAGRELSMATQTLQSILGGAKTRGILGEVTLERMLEDALPRAAFDTQYRFSSGDIVDAIVRVGDRLLPIDSKFPLDAFRRLADVGDEARKEFAQAVRKHADSIAGKYILPGELTLDFALMFIPSEGVYYEILLTEDGKYGRLEDYCRSKKVIPVSPNTCYAHLCMIELNLRGIRVEENARKLLANLGGLEKQLNGFAEVYQRLGTHLRNAGQSYEQADEKLQRARGALEQMAQGALPEAAPPLLEADRSK
ncbi:MAG TPA: DNA recombination protein RmuC [Candidatus Acidoferrales bacterium]|nr:DNA recombination protein RmuC [Candidatus Acidoferrales bacterium]